MASPIPRTDYTSQRFGMLEVIKYLGKSRWLCLCDCGEYKDARLDSLKIGQTWSCGCKNNIKGSQAIDYTGQRFGRLLVLNRVENNESHVQWRCSCDCGEVVIINSASIRVGTKSCGCYQRECAKINNTKYNSYNILTDYVEIVDASGNTILVDREDFNRVKGCYWFTGSHGYAVNSDGDLMHRLIMQPPEDKVIDHIFHNKLDNRKRKLRICDHSDNMKNQKLSKDNSSGVTGVTRHQNSWRADICVNGVKHTLGLFDKIEDAAKVRSDAEIKYFKEFRFRREVI